MGLLSFRKKSSDDQTPAVEEKPSADVIGSNLSNDAWLAGVERRDEIAPAAEPHDSAYDYPIAEAVPAVAEDVPAIETQYEAAADQLAEVQDHTLQAPLSTTPTLQGGPAYPDMGIVYAGLETAGVATFPSEGLQNTPDSGLAPPIAEAPAPQEMAPTIESEPSPFPTIEHGPIGPEAADFLRTLGLSTGCSWDDVNKARRAILEALASTGSPEELQACAEVNHAYASLRLLRVGPLKA